MIDNGLIERANLVRIKLREDEELRREEARRRAEKGLAWLLESGPQFNLFVEDLILDRLDLASCTKCVLGQLGRDYLNVLPVVCDGKTHDDREEWAREHGFQEDYPISSGSVRYGDLTPVWKELISEYRTLVVS